MTTKLLLRLFVGAFALSLVAGCDELDDNHHHHRYHRHDEDGAYTRVPPPPPVQPPPPPPGYSGDSYNGPRHQYRDDDSYDDTRDEGRSRPPRIRRDDDDGY